MTRAAPTASATRRPAPTLPVSATRAAPTASATRPPARRSQSARRARRQRRARRVLRPPRPSSATRAAPTASATRPPAPTLPSARRTERGDHGGSLRGGGDVWSRAERGSDSVGSHGWADEAHAPGDPARIRAPPPPTPPRNPRPPPPSRTPRNRMTGTDGAEGARWMARRRRAHAKPGPIRRCLGARWYQ